MSQEWLDARDELTDELERQARETMRVIRDSAGELGERVRRVIERTGDIWDRAGPGTPPASGVAPADEQRARQLARRWKSIDFLIDPELAEGMSVTAVHDAGLWRIEVRERGETRSLAESTEPYEGVQPSQISPVLPVWDYHYPVIPDLESGERRERLPDSGMIGACLRCNGTGHRPCAECERKGFVQCPVCHGRARVVCRRCRGRGRIADEVAERRARATKSYLQVHAERMALDAAERLADLSERLRQEYGVPLPPSGQWAPMAPASGETIPCPDCTDGKVKCSCGSGKLVCSECRGSAQATCRSCHGRGRVVRYRELVRRFDTRISSRVVAPVSTALASLINERMLRRASGDEVWEGPVERLSGDAPSGVPASVWAQAQELLREASAVRQIEPASATAPEAKPANPVDGESERRVISRRARLTRIPLTHVEYSFLGQPFAFLAVGRGGSERFWAETFPPRWSRVSRFFKALMRDLDTPGEPPSRPIQGPVEVAVLEEYRARRNGSVHQVQIVEEGPADQPPQVHETGAEETSAQETSANGASATYTSEQVSRDVADATE
jgi:hypothetical protein